MNQYLIRNTFIVSILLISSIFFGVVKEAQAIPNATNNSNSVTRNIATMATGNVLTDDDGDGIDSVTLPTGLGITDIFRTTGEIVSVNGTNVATGSNVNIVGSYGTLTINDDGDYSYQLDGSNPSILNLYDGDSLQEVFSYDILEPSELINNGSFDGVIGTVDRNTLNGTIPTDWTQINSSDIWDSSTNVNGADIPDSPDGGDFIHSLGDGASSEGISQSLDNLLTNGVEYYYQYYFSAATNFSIGGSARTGSWLVNLGGSTTDLSFAGPNSISTPDFGANPSAWEYKAGTRNPTVSTLTSLSLVASNDTDPIDMLIDGISVIGYDTVNSPRDSANLSITINGNGEALFPPTDITLTPSNISEGNLAGVIGTLTTTDPNPGDTHSYSFCRNAGADRSLFSLNTSTGELSTTEVFDFESPVDANGDNVYEFCIRSSDGVSGAYEETMFLTVEENFSPTDISLSPSSITEGNLAGVIGTISTTDVNINDVHSYANCSISASDQSLFSVNTNTGELSTTEVFDFESPVDANGDNIYEFCITSDDGISPSYSKTLTLSITQTGVAPTDITLTPSTISEGNLAGVIGTLTTTDPNPGDTHSYSFCRNAGADRSLFSLNTSTGELSTTEVFDFESPVDANGDNVYEFCIRSSDGVSGAYEETMFLTVNKFIPSTSSSSSRKGGNSIKYICKDKKAINYDDSSFGKTNNALCKYKDQASPLLMCEKSFTNYYKRGSYNEGIKDIQNFLNQELGTNLAVDGINGGLTTAAIVQFQEKYFDEILKPWGLTRGTGYWYQSTRHKANGIMGCEDQKSITLDNGVVIK